jgi:diguanylate cyclase (GGDEF)-like protein/PAS domain S-box-containing protein
MYIMNALNRLPWFAWLLIYCLSVSVWHWLTYSFYGQASYRIGGPVILAALIYLTQSTYRVHHIATMSLGIFAANYLIENVLLGISPLASAITSLTLIFQAFLGWFLLRRFTPDAQFPNTLKKSINFLIFAVTLPVLASSIIQPLLERLVSPLPFTFNGIEQEFLYWTALRFTSMVIITPLLLWQHDRQQSHLFSSLAKTSTFVWTLLAGLIIAVTVFSIANPEGRALATYSSLLMPFTLFAAIRLPLLQSLLVVLCISVVSFWADSRYAGQSQQVINSLIALSVFISFNALVAWLVGMMLHDRDQHLEKETSLHHLYEMLSRFNQLLIKQPLEKPQLFESACKIILEETKFDRVSIIHFDNTTSNENVVNCALARTDSDIITTPPFVDKNCDLVKRVLVSQAYELFQSNKHVHDESSFFGYNSVAAFPINQKLNCVGCLLIFSKREFIFTPEMLRLFQELADDTGFAISMHDSQKRLKQTTEVFDYSCESIIITDGEGTILDVNPAFSIITGYSREEAIGQNPRMLKSDKQDSAFYGSLFLQLQKHGIWSGEFWNKRKNSELYLQRGSLTTVLDSDGTILHIISIMEDVTQRQQDETTILHLANYDQLTGLPNRILLNEYFLRASAESQRSGLTWALLFIDLDKFKEINDAFGHHYGDELLRLVTARLSSHIRETDLFSRFGGDEFIIIAQCNMDEASQMALRYIEEIKQEFLIEELDVHIGASIGIAMFPQDGINLEDLIQAADTAMYKAKALGGNESVFFNLSMQKEVQEQMAMRSNLDKAITNNELTLYFQPKVTVTKGDVQIVGYEALIRWPQKDGGMISPANFIPLAEKIGLISDIDQWVLKNAITKISDWLVRYPGCVLPVAVNVSASLFADREFVSMLTKTITHFGLPPALLELEITERVAMLDVEYTLNTLKELKKIGIGLSIDDFGTGYSNLAYLRLYPVDVLKIDITFVKDVHLDEKKQNLVRAIISMAQALGMKTIAEGVECQEELDFLVNEKCDQYQGFFFGKPVAEEKLIFNLTSL